MAKNSSDMLSIVDPAERCILSPSNDVDDDGVFQCWSNGVPSTDVSGPVILQNTQYTAPSPRMPRDVAGYAKYANLPLSSFSSPGLIQGKINKRKLLARKTTVWKRG